jgi:hypothetical protein
VGAVDDDRTSGTLTPLLTPTKPISVGQPRGLFIEPSIFHDAPGKRQRKLRELAGCEEGALGVDSSRGTDRVYRLSVVRAGPGRAAVLAIVTHPVTRGGRRADLARLAVVEGRHSVASLCCSVSTI